MKKEKSIIEHFSVISDPRIERHKKHKLIDIIVISVCAIISGCQTFVEIENYGNSKIDWLKSMLELPNGIPSHDTIGRVFSLINALEFQKAFYEWTQGFVNLSEEIINIDGKYIRASHGASEGKLSIFGMVNAWASNAGIALAQLRTDYEKKSEKEALKDIISFLELEGALVTLDANGCTAEIANAITRKKGDFLIGLKKNQKSIYGQVEKLFGETEISNFHETNNKGHGRIEKRTCSAINLPQSFHHFLKKKTAQRQTHHWEKLKSVCKIESIITIKGKTTKEVRYYIHSRKADAEKMLNAARSHWGVENKLHWQLDVSFNEDSCRVRNGYAGENLAVIRQLALNLIKQEKSTKKSVRVKQLLCSWENPYLSKVITGITPDNYVI